VLAHGEAPAQGLAHQAVHHHGAQVVLLQPEQRHRAAAEMRAQAADEALQAHVGGQFGGQVGQPRGFNQGIHDLLMVLRTF